MNQTKTDETLGCELAEKVKVSVTAGDIAAGAQGSCSSCPIALAVKRLFPAEKMVEVKALTVTIWDIDEQGNSTAQTVGYGLPVAARDFIQLFDDSRAFVEPFEFEMIRM